MTDEPTLRLAEGRRLLDAGDPSSALTILSPLTGHPDPDVAGEAWLLIGTARYRTDDELGALTAWQHAAQRGGSSAWLGWRSVAEQRVRDGELAEAIEAYREAERRAPPHERGAIANRVGWLLKETGHDFAARRQFNRARGAYATYNPFISYGLIAANVVVFLADMALAGLTDLGLLGAGGPLVNAGLISAEAVAAGEWYRILTSAFLHLGLLHLAFNMYALYLFGPIVEQLYGHLEFLVLYLLCAAGGSVLTILLDPGSAAAGASGAIFGLFGLAFVVRQRHHVLLGRETRAILSQVGGLLVVNLIITFAVPFISWTGHLGGLFVGAAIGYLLPPTYAATIAGMFRTPAGQTLTPPVPGFWRAVVYAGVTAILVTGSYVAVLRFVG
jgi:membrane associated rhomboid family serine protease